MESPDTPMATPLDSESMLASSKMEVVYFSNEFPKADLETIFRRLHNSGKDRSQPYLSHFIREATLAVKDEIRHLSADLKSLFKPFDNILSWAEDSELRQGPLNGAVGGVLLVVTQLAVFLGLPQEHHAHWENSTNKALAALGVGLLSTTAVALASSVADLPLTGSDAVRIAFRMGVHVQSVSENLESLSSGETPDTWAYVVHNVDAATAQKELDAMYGRDAASNTDKVFLSAVSRTSVTVSGPPQKLKSLFSKSRLFRDSTSIPLPVYGGLCHAPHIYDMKDVWKIIHGGPLSTMSSDSDAIIKVYSTSTGAPYAAKNAAALLESVVSELLTEAIYWDKVIDGIVGDAQFSMASEVVLHNFGNSIPLHDLERSLKSNLTECDISTNDLMQWISESGASSSHTPRGSAQSKLAIVGTSCRLPGGATSLDKFWSVLEQGLDVSREIPADRFDIETHYDPTGKDLNKSMTKYGCFIDEPGMFDAPFFNMSPREAQEVDPQMRLALVTAYEALEQSGYVGNRTPSTQSGRIGTYYGQAADDYREVNQGQEVSTYYIPGGCRAFGPGRINYFFKFAGPSYSIDTACSSGLAAVEVACQALWSGTVDTAVTGGLNVLTNPDGFAGLCNGHFLTKGHNACKTWDATADGYCRADGVVSFVIKRLEDAEADNDRILGTILGAGTNHSAEAVSITHPHAGHQQDLARSVLQQSGVNPIDVSYVELHGTGTQAGDYEEVNGVMGVYAPLKKGRNKNQPLHMGAVKSNFGHSESAAGATSLLKVLLMLQKDVIPRHIGIKTEINPRFPKDMATSRHLHIPFEQTAWPKTKGQSRLAVVNSFGAAGGNTTMILEDARVSNVFERDPRNTAVVTVSAKTKSSLAGNIKRLLEYLDTNPDAELCDLSYTTTARRYQHGFRVAATSSSAVSLRKQFASRLEHVDSIKPVARSNPPPVAFAFTGQGSSHSSMNLELYRDVPAVKDHIQQLDHLAQRQGFASFIPALDGSYSEDHKHSAVVTQLSLVCLEIALAKYWSSIGIRPDVVVGHSLGEYAAMNVAGVLSASDVIYLVGRRAQMLQEKCTSGSHIMMAVRAPLARITESLPTGQHTVACINGPDATVLSGTKEQMDSAANSLEAHGMRCIKLDVQYAFHSEQMEPILDDFEDVAKAGVVFREPKMPIISPLLGNVVFDSKKFTGNYVRRATREAVNFQAAIETAREVSVIDDETVWVEIGPHPTCASFLGAINPTARPAVPSLRRSEDNWKTITEALSALYLAGVQINWNEFHRPFESKLCLLDLPTYAFSEKNHWLQYRGDWCLTKGNNFYKNVNRNLATDTGKPIHSATYTSTVHQIVEETVNGDGATVSMRSDLMQQDFLAAANGHRMNDCGVVTSSIHADIVYTLGEYLMHKCGLKTKDMGMDIASLAVTKGLVAQKKDKSPQVIQVTATTTDIHSKDISFTWQNVDKAGNAQETFATATLALANTSMWLDSWSPMDYLIHSRVEILEQLAADGTANRFTRSMAYKLFASNLVDYADKYRGMQSVVVHELEGFADVQLTTEESGVSTVPPYFVDSVAHLAGFIMNCSDAVDSENYFCVTPGWRSMKFAKPLVPGARYRSYVRMIPSAEDPTAFFGDVYIMQGNSIMGVVAGIEFHRYPRVLLSRFFSPPDSSAAAENKTKPAIGTISTASTTQTQQYVASAHAAPVTHDQKPLPINKPEASAAPPKNVKANTQGVTQAATVNESPPTDSSVTQKALELIADEAALEPGDLEDDAQFADVGVDSLMSLVISEKLKSELEIDVSGSLFLDYPTIGDLRSWLDEYYS